MSKEREELYFGKSVYKGKVYSIARFLNYLFLALFAIVLLASEWFLEYDPLIVPNFYWMLMIVLCPIISSVIVSIVKLNHDFLEWDKKEREKRNRFMSGLNFVVHFFTYLSGFNMICTLALFKDTELYVSNNTIFLYSFYTLLFILNALFPVKLHRKLFDEDLLQSSYCAEKPENWDWEYDERSSSYW